jgi:Flp pilus assembly pilin Flp
MQFLTAKVVTKASCLGGLKRGSNMRMALTTFLNDEDGAVTVDWVVITAGICMLVITLFTYLRVASYEAAAAGIRDRVTEAQNIASTP